MYIKTRQPTERELPAKKNKKGKEIRKPSPQPDRLQMHVKPNKRSSSAWKRLFRTLQSLAIDESADHQSIQMKQIYAIIDTPCLYHFAIFRVFLIKHTRG